MNTLLIPIDQIDVGDRLRAIDEDYAALLAESIAEQGQMTPVEVRATPKAALPYALVSGGHRMRAMQIAGIGTAAAVLFTGSKLQARLREIDENLIRHELTQLDRSTFLAERKTVYEALHPEARHGGSTKVANFAAFSDDAAEKMGVSARLVRLAVLRHGRLHADVRAKIAGLWIADHGAQLDALAKLPPDEQRAVADVLLQFPGIRSVAVARLQASGAEPEPPADPMELQFDAFLRLWRRMPEAVRRRVRTHVNAKSKANAWRDA